MFGPGPSLTFDKNVNAIIIQSLVCFDKRPKLRPSIIVRSIIVRSIIRRSIIARGSVLSKVKEN